MCIFPKIQLFTLAIFSSNLPCVKIINKFNIYRIQWKNNVYISQDKLFTLVFLSSNLPCVKIINKFNILFIILTLGKLELKNTNVNNCILGNIYIALPLYHITSILMMARE